MIGEVVSIDRIRMEARNAARANIDPHAACTYGFDSPGGRVFLIEYAKELHRIDSAKAVIRITPDARNGEAPCAECRLPVGETCELCGAQQP